uniref:Alpha-mannosidase n=1 Tax=Chrysemys picta bellii TaxID=8478 RepID=A0A8C3HLI8_CHRPI
MKLSRQFTVFGSAIFCVVIFSLYLMLDRGHFDHPKSPRREGTFPKGQLSILQEKIDHLERLLAENNEIISNIRDSVINLSESVKDGQRNPEAINFSQGSFSELLPSALVSLTIDPEDCSFASKSGSQDSNVQMLDVYDILPFDNPDGGVWKQGFDITYNENEWDDEPLQVFVVPHSHNDPGWLKTFDDYFRDQTQHILNNMVVKLQEDNKRKFMWSEISYFSKWWDGIDSQKKDAVKRFEHLYYLLIYTIFITHAGPAGNRIRLAGRHGKPQSFGFFNLHNMWEWFQTAAPSFPIPSTCWLGHLKWVGHLKGEAAVFGLMCSTNPTKPSARTHTHPILWDVRFTPANSGDDFCSATGKHSFYIHFFSLIFSRAAEILYSLALVESKKSDKMNAFPSVDHYKLLTEARRNLGLFQHHDAITGTSKDWVVVDYGTRLFHSLMNLKRVIIDSAHILILKDKDTYSYNPSAPFLKMDDDQSSQDSLPRKTVIKLSIQPRYLLVYNPTEQERFSVVSIYVNSPKVKVLSPSGKPVMVQISGVWDGTTTVSHEAYQISFMVHLPPLGLGVYQLLEVLSSEMILADYNIYTSGGNNVQVNPDKVFKIKEMQNSADDITLENSYMKLWFSGISGLLKKINTKEDGKNHQIKVEFAWYGTTSNRDKSGAYLFLPDGEAKPYVFTDPPTIRVTHGRIFSEVTCFFHHLTHTVRLYKVQGLEGESLELSNIVDIRGEYNREIAMRISSDVNSQNRFYTDLNGYQIQPRVAMNKLPLQANIYPMTTMAYIQDDGIRLTLHSAQSLGVTSLKSGQLEVIMDRRLMQDDNRGLGQGLQDNKITANLFRLLLERRNEVDEVEKSSVSFPSLLSHITSSFINHPVIPMTTYAESGVPQILNAFSPLTSSMPCDMHVHLNFVCLQADSGPSDEAALILHRKGFDCKFSNKDTGLLCSTTQGKIKVHKLFNKLIIESLIPTSLSLMHSPPDARNISEINMSSMEINTFRIRLR